MRSFPRIVFLIIFCSIGPQSNEAKGQVTFDLKIDSLNTKISLEKNDTSTILLLQSAIYVCLNHGELKLMDGYLEKLKEAVDKYPWPKGEMIYHHAKGIYLFYQSDYEASLKENLSSLKIAKEINDKRAQARSYGNIALLYQVQADYLTSLEFHFKGLEMEKKVKNKEGIASSYNNIGIVYEHLGQLKKALSYQTKSVKLRLKIKDYALVHNNYSNLGNIYFSMNNMDSALRNYDLSLEYAKKTESGNAMGTAIANIANVYYVQKQYKKAIEFSRKAYKLFIKVGNDRGWIASAGNMGENYLHLNQLDSARYYVDMSIKKAKEINGKDLELSSLRTLMEINEREGRFKDAFYVQRHLYRLRDSIQGEEKKADLARFEVKQEYAVKEERRKANAMLENRKQEIILYSVIGGLVLSLLFGFVVLRSLNTNKKKNKIIEQQKRIVESKQKEVIDSIHYAKRIQQALLPSSRYIDKNMKRLND